MVARKHHYVPQCYLKQFAVSHKKTPQICVFDRIEKKVFKTGIDNVAAERDFNSINIEGVPTDLFENEMSHFESELAVALARINTVQSIANEDDRAYLLNLVCMTALRNPQLRETMRSAIEQTAKITMDLILESPERYSQHRESMKRDGFGKAKDVSYENMKSFHESGRYRISVNTGFHVRQEIELFDRILPILFKRGWQLLRAPKGSGGFITSDHPFCLSWSDPGRRGGFYGPGLGMLGTEVVFPVSPRLALLGAFEIEDAEIEVTERLVVGVNGAVIAMAERQVYSRDNNFAYSMHPDEPHRKASRLLSDRRFIERKTEDP